MEARYYFRVIFGRICPKHSTQGQLTAQDLCVSSRHGMFLPFAASHPPLTTLAEMWTVKVESKTQKRTGICTTEDREA